MKDDYGNTHTSNILNICIAQDIFLYKLSNHIYGFGVSIKSSNEIYEFKTLIIIIKDNNFFDFRN